MSDDVLRPAIFSAGGELELLTFSEGHMASCECYYKRTQDSGLVRVYFRDPATGIRKGTVDVVPPGHELLRSGHLYEIDVPTDLSRPVTFNEVR